MQRKKSSIYEFSARRLKADKLADVIQGASGTSAEAAKMDDRNWAMVVSLAGVNPPSAETKKLVIEILHEREDACRCLANLDLYPAAA